MAPSDGIRSIVSAYSGYSSRSSRKSEDTEDRTERFGRGEARRRGKKNRSEPTPPSNTTPTNPTTPVEVPTQPTTPPVSTLPKSTDIQGLAERYVTLYQKQSGHTLSTDEYKAKVEEVKEFYSEPSRAGRLYTLVSAQEGI